MKMKKMSLQELDADDVPETMTVDIDEDEVKRLKVGQKLELLVKGTVGMLQVPPDGVSGGNPAMMGIKVSSKKLRGLSQVDEMLNEDEDEEDG
jgi:hypothetical protein